MKQKEKPIMNAIDIALADDIVPILCMLDATPWLYIPIASLTAAFMRPDIRRRVPGRYLKIRSLMFGIAAAAKADCTLTYRKEMSHPDDNLFVVKSVRKMRRPHE